MNKKLKQIFSFCLACFMLLLCPVSAYASVQSPSDADYWNEEPFYYDENGNKVYDSDIDWSQYRTEPNYDDILWTFEEYPETMMASGDMDTYIVGADDAVVIAVVAAACAACGVAIARSDIPDFVSKGFEPWLRRNKVSDTETMNMWQSLFNTTVGTSFVGMELLAQNLKEFLGLSTYGTASLNVPVTSIKRDAPFFDRTDKDKFVAFATATSLSGQLHYYDVCSPYSLSAYPVQCVYLSPLSTAGTYNFRFAYRPDPVASPTKVETKVGTLIYNIYTSGGYFQHSYPQSIESNYGAYYKSMFAYFSIPVFIDRNAADSYLIYGTMGGIVNGDYLKDTFSVNTVNQWTDLKQDFLTRWAVSDTFNIPNTQEALDSLVDSLADARTGTDVVAKLNTVWTITDNNGGTDVVPVVAYTSLSYVLDAIAAYVGVSALTAEQRNGFIADYLNVSSSGLTIDQLSAYAQTIVKSQIAITGTAENNDANTFVVTSAFTSAFLSYLLSAGLIDTIPEIKAGTQLKTNVKVETKIDSGTLPPDGGTADLSGILGLLTSILSTLGGLPGLIASEAVKALTSSAFANGITLNLDTIRSSLTNIAQWDFADWTTALGASVLLALKAFAKDFRLDSIADVLDSIARWDFADWDLAFGSAIQVALTALGFDKLIGLADVLKGWDFADWSSVLRSVLDAALVTSGLAGLAGILSDMLLDLGGISRLLTDIKNALTSAPDALLQIVADILNAVLVLPEAIKNILISLFVPTVNPFEGLKDKLDSKFPIFVQLKDFFNGLMFKAGSGIPEFTFTYMGVTVNIFNVQWFLQFLPFIHGLIISIAYYKYLRRLYRRLPSVIGGIGS